MLRKCSIAAGLAIACAFAVRPAAAELIYGLNESGTNIFSFDSSNTGKVLSGKFLTGLATNEQLVTIDLRPSNGQIYGVGSLGNLYTVNAGTGALSKVSTITGATIDGTNFGSDFNPVSSGFNGDTLQFSSDTGINWSINPTTGVATANGTLNYGTGDAHAGGNTNIVGLAYSNNVTGATSTVLYGIDSGYDSLVNVTASSGSMTTIGALGINVTDLVGFDISGSGSAFAALQTTTSGISDLYRINLTTGAATLVGEIGGGLLVRDITVAPGGTTTGGGGGGGGKIPEPASLGVLTLGGLLFMSRRIRRV